LVLQGFDYKVQKEIGVFKPRQLRLDAPGALHYVMGRDIDGIEIFSNRKDREDFLLNVWPISVKLRPRASMLGLL
jgi:hypothetical protein